VSWKHRLPKTLAICWNNAGRQPSSCASAGQLAERGATRCYAAQRSSQAAAAHALCGNVEDFSSMPAAVQQSQSVSHLPDNC
jgi:hypothetical protein